MPMKIPRIMIAAPSSGSGKTVASCALMEAFIRQKRKVAACKCGPDYIDPMFHREVLGVDSENLDLFFCPREELPPQFARHAERADIAVIEGVMGYYDGMTLDTLHASSYDVARTLQAPVILILDAKGIGFSVTALIEGMVRFRPDSNIQGILLNQISHSLYNRMKPVIETELQERGMKIPVVGYLPRDEAFHLESRHLRLVTPAELGRVREQMEQAGKLLTETVDLQYILQIAQEAPEISTDLSKKDETDRNQAVTPVAVARDEAFGFYYKENLQMLEQLGCKLLYFSPLHDTSLPAGAKGLLLGGGYPEVYARQLSENVRMRRCIYQAVRGGLPCLAECGGFLYLQEELEDTKGVVYPMAGVLQGGAFSKGTLVRFGYVSIEGRKDGRYLRAGEIIRGHEFHYWDSTDNGRDCLAVKPDGRKSWECIHMEGNLFAGYPHLSYPSFPGFARRFVECCRTEG